MSKSRLYKTLFTYGAGEFLNKLIPFLLLPILTHYLTPQEYGYIAIYMAVMSLLLVFISLSLQSTISVFYFKVDEDALRDIVSSSIALSFFSLVIMQTILFAMNTLIESYFNVDVNWLQILSFSVFFQSIGLYYLTFLRMSNNAKYFVVFQIFLTLINASLSLFLVIALEYSWQGRVLGVVIGTMTLGLFALFQLVNKMLFTINSITKKTIIKNIKFSAPLVLHGFSSWIKSSLDKFLLMGYLTASVTGEYTVIYQICSVLLIFFMMLNQMLQPELFKILKDKKDGFEQRLTNYLKLLVIGVIFISFLFYFILPYLYPLIINGRYEYNNNIAAILITAFCLQGLYFVVVNFLYFYEKTLSVGKVSLINGVFHVFLAFLLIPRFGMEGAAWLALLSLLQFTLSICFVVYKNKLFPSQLKKRAKNELY